MKLASLAMIAAAVLCCQTTFHTTTKLIEVSVVVTDKVGKSVEGLTQADFELTDGGKQQELRTFSVQHGQQGAATAETLPAGFFSNRLSAGGAPNSATVILVDALNTPPEYYGQARQKLSEFLHGIDPRFRVAIYKLGSSGLMIFHDFTSDTALLARKAMEARDLLAASSESGLIGRVEQARPEQAGAVLFGGGDALDVIAAMIARADRLSGGFESANRISATFKALTAIANRLKAVPGRKNLVWISAGLPLKIGFTGFASRRPATDVQFSAGERDAAFTGEYDRAVRALNDAAVAVYPVDARGVLALADAAGFSLDRGRANDIGASVFTAQRGGLMASNISVTESHTTMKQLAVETGGRLYSGDGVDKALSDVFENTRVSYVLGYYAPPVENDGRFRKIQVKVKRPGVRVMHRTGYYAVADERTAQDDAKAALQAAVWSPVDATAVPVDAVLEMAPGASGAAEGERTVELHVDGRALAFEPAESGLRCRLEIFVVQKDGEGRQIDASADALEWPLKQEQAAAVEKAGLTHRKKLRVQPTAFMLRVVVRNPVTGALGSLTIPLGKRAVSGT
ncbi:MAG TPA: VWA domain-containing protein [Bryobacteraceae bacterium]|nr:VWA domain-containing protein [Bryobacteraceae bacterium]